MRFIKRSIIFIAAVVGMLCASTAFAQLADVRDSITFASLSSENIKNVTSNLTLPLVRDDVQIIWTSSDENIIEISGNTGIVKRPPFGEGYANVFLTAQFVSEDGFLTKRFLVRVCEEEIGYTYSNKILSALDTVDKSFIGSVNPLEVTKDIIIPTAPQGIEVHFFSDDETVVTNDGKILPRTDSDSFCTVHFSIEYGYEKIKLSYPLIVKAITTQGAQNLVAGDLAWLDEYFSSYDLTKLTNNITLPQKGPNGTIFSWSSNSTAITSAGVITRSDDDVNAVLSVSGSMEKYTASRDFNVTIYKKAPKNENENGGLKDTSGGGGGGAIKITKDEQTKGDTGVEITQPEDSSKSVFSDISDDHWAYTEIKYLVDRGIMSGVAEGVIEPQRTIRREEFIKLLVSAMGIETNGNNAEFTDVESGSWYAPYIAAAKESGILNGYADGRAGIGEEISREDMAVMIFRAAELIGEKSENQFTDHEEILDYAVEAVYTLQKNGVINGMGDGSFAPKAKATRAETACMIYKTIKKGLFD